VRFGGANGSPEVVASVQGDLPGPAFEFLQRVRAGAERQSEWVAVGVERDAARSKQQ
jgi:hypothetical protein